MSIRDDEGIELAVERKFDLLDRSFTRGEITGEVYDRRCLQISQWAEEAYRAIDRREMDREGW